MKKEIPSQTTQYYWIYAEAPNYFQVDKTGDVGKWLIFTPIKNVDVLWKRIRVATEKGLLGYSSKVATAKSDTQVLKVICVYTYDAKDEKDVWEVERALRKLGIKGRFCYKTNEVTRLEAKGQVFGGEEKYQYVSDQAL